MSIRLKVFLIIAAIVMVITMSSMLISISSAQTQILKTLEVDMGLVASLTNEFISGEIDRLQTDAAAVAQALKNAQSEELRNILIEQTAAYTNFTAITIFNSAGKIDMSYGIGAATEEMAHSENAQEAFEGKRTISTSCFDSSGNLVFYVFVPLDNPYNEETDEQYLQSKIVACAVPGLFFSEQLNRYLIWNTGNIAMHDRKGVIIANVHTEWVMERLNFIEMAENDSRYEGIARVTRLMTDGKYGTDRYNFDNADVLVAYMPITTSGQGWSLAIIAPIKESPFYRVRAIIAIAGIVFLGLGLLTAAFSSGSIAKPFYILKEKNIRLIELGEEVQAASKAKSNFLAGMSHEMRTPLNAIIAFCELTLKEQNLTQNVVNNLHNVYESGMVLLGVINNLLDISKIESEKFGIIPAKYDLANFINNTASINRIYIGAKPITFEVIPDENLPAWLFGDELQVRQIFSNLLTNAFNYTNEGNVQWRISAEREEDSIWLNSSISDTGPGIKPEDIGNIFSDYKNMDIWKGHVSERSGLRLGLALAKRIAEFMDGTITVESIIGKGSVFKVRIRQKIVDDAVIDKDTIENLKNFRYTEQRRISNTPQKYIQLPEKRVLVVDDISINLEVAKWMLTPYEMMIDCVENGQTAVDLIRKGEPHYDAIFMDYMMPEMDGIEAVRIIRTEIGTEYAKTLPIIVVTANAIDGSGEIFLTNGFQDYLPKPIEPDSLDRVIHRWIVR